MGQPQIDTISGSEGDVAQLVYPRMPRHSDEHSHFESVLFSPTKHTSPSNCQELEDLLHRGSEEHNLTHEKVLECYIRFLQSSEPMSLHQLGGLAGEPSSNFFVQASGFGWAPWEIHRPQKAIVELARRGGFKGSVCEIGCGLGDNALFISKYCGCQVTAFDLLDRCIAFAKAKAALRGDASIHWHVADVMAMTGSCLEPSPPTYDILLDVGVFHKWSDQERIMYIQNLSRLAHPGTVYYQLSVSERDPHPLPPRKISREEIGQYFNEGSGWRVEGVEEVVVETHPSIAQGRREGYLATILRL